MHALPSPLSASTAVYRRAGQSGLHLSPIGLALVPAIAGSANIDPTLVPRAIELGVNFFDITPTLASYRYYEEVVERSVAAARPCRDELVITTRIGLGTSPGPLVGFGSRKRILSDLERRLRQAGLDYIDVLFNYRFDTSTPLEETMAALASAVTQGKVLYVGLSGLSPAITRQAASMLEDLGTPPVLYEAPYSLVDRWVEGDLLEILNRHGIGCIACAPLSGGTLTAESLSRLEAPEYDSALYRLARVARLREQTAEQLAISWSLRSPGITAALLRTSSVDHLEENMSAASRTDFQLEELQLLDGLAPLVRTDG